MLIYASNVTAWTSDNRSYTMHWRHACYDEHILTICEHQKFATVEENAKCQPDGSYDNIE